MDDLTKENMKEHNPSDCNWTQNQNHLVLKRTLNHLAKLAVKHNPTWPQIPYHPYSILIIGGSGSGKTNSVFNLINHQPDID